MPADPGQLIVSTHFGDVLVGGSGADTLVGGAGTDQMTGGAGADLFQFAAKPYNGAEITDFQLGVDRLDISALYAGGYAGANPVADGYVRFDDNGAGGTKVMLDADGPSGTAHSFFQLVAVLDNVAPAGLTVPQVFGAPPGVTLTSSHYGDVLVGGAGNDTLIAGQGPDKLTGGAGADLFVYHAKPYNGGEIADFQAGVDKLDISSLFQAGYHGADPVADGYVRFDSDGAGNTKVMIDADGPAGPGVFQLATILDHLAPVGLTAAAVFGATAAGAAPVAQTTTAAVTRPAFIPAPQMVPVPPPAPAASAHVASAAPAQEAAPHAPAANLQPVTALLEDHHIQHLAGAAHGGDFLGAHWDMA